jgi:hypothetical protein
MRTQAPVGVSSAGSANATAAFETVFIRRVEFLKLLAANVGAQPRTNVTAVTCTCADHSERLATHP